MQPHLWARGRCCSAGAGFRAAAPGFAQGTSGQQAGLGGDALPEGVQYLPPHDCAVQERLQVAAAGAGADAGPGPGREDLAACSAPGGMQQEEAAADPDSVGMQEPSGVDRVGDAAQPPSTCPPPLTEELVVAGSALTLMSTRLGGGADGHAHPPPHPPSHTSPRQRDHHPRGHSQGSGDLAFGSGWGHAGEGEAEEEVLASHGAPCEVLAIQYDDLESHVRPAIGGTTSAATTAAGGGGGGGGGLAVTQSRRSSHFGIGFGAAGAGGLSASPSKARLSESGWPMVGGGGGTGSAGDAAVLLLPPRQASAGDFAAGGCTASGWGTGGGGGAGAEGGRGGLPGAGGGAGAAGGRGGAGAGADGGATRRCAGAAEVSVRDVKAARVGLPVLQPALSLLHQATDQVRDGGGDVDVDGDGNGHGDDCYAIW